MSLQVYNTLSRQKEDFKPLHEGRVGMYVCGPTVYGHSHIGHAKSYVSFDAIVRYLRYAGYKVLYVQNITDVGHLTDDADAGEDKIEKQSRLDRVHPMQIADMFTTSYFEDMDALGVLRPDITPRASGHIIEQIEVVEQLVRSGFAYIANGSVYFDVTKFAGYGKLSGRSVEDLEAGARIDVNPEKRHPADFALWKKAEPEHIMQWSSPWGKGYPGWHIECSAMSMKYLGESFDIHGGGLENQFPHHECEIAQSECSTGKPFVKYWIHNNMVTANGQKMGKSLGNFVNLKDAFKKFDPLVVRFFILQSHYRSTLDFSDDAVTGAKVGLEKLLNTVRNLREEISKPAAADRTAEATVDLQHYETRFVGAMNDDFNTPQAIAVLFDLSRETNALLSLEEKFTIESLRRIEKFFMTFGGSVLGILSSQSASLTSGDVALEADLTQLLVDLRTDVRAQKLWPLSDKIRDGLKKIGITIEDKKDGTVWRKG
ncbi:MAG: cysteine--tRNA ligase [Ignavibacteriales bacterium]|nr:cysteine--tRNA ligase [Ignavibacteriales bacterium]